MISVAYAIVLTTAKQWRRESASVFGISERLIRVAEIVLLLASLGFGLGLAVFSTAQIDMTIPENLRLGILRSTYATPAMLSTVVVAILTVTLPARTSLQTLLELLPVRRTAANLGQFAPLLGVAFLLSSTLSLPTLAVLVKVIDDPWRLMLAVALFATTVATTVVIAFSSANAMRTFLTKLWKLPFQYSSAIAAAITASGCLFAQAGEVLSPATSSGQGAGFELRDLLLSRAVSSLVSGNDSVATWIDWAAWGLVALLALSVATRARAAPPPSGTLRFAANVRPFRGHFPAAFWMELLIGIRNAQAIIAVITIAPLLATVRWVQSFDVLAPVAAGLASSVAAMPFLLALYAVGRTIRFRWIGRLIVATDNWWILPKLSAYWVIGGALAFVVTVVELTFGMATMGDVMSIICRTAVCFGSALVAGALVPYSEEQSISVAVSGFVMVVMYMGTNLISLWSSQFLGADGASWLLAAVAITLICTFVAICQGQRDHDLRSV